MFSEQNLMELLSECVCRKRTTNCYYKHFSSKKKYRKGYGIMSYYHAPIISKALFQAKKIRISKEK